MGSFRKNKGKELAKRFFKNRDGVYRFAREIAFFFQIRINPFISYRNIYFKKKIVFDIKQFKFKQLKIDFVILGAQKSGTTSLHNYLDTHREIFMSFPMKESRYFLGEKFVREFYKDRFNWNVKNLNSLFRNFIIRGYKNQKLIGDSTTAYTLGKRSLEWSIPERMFRENPDLKFIYVLRNPFERMVSHYYHIIERKDVSMEFNELLKVENSILETSLYFRQLKHYLKHFDNKRFKIVFFEKFINNREETLNEVVSFLGLPQMEMIYDRIFNESKEKSGKKEKKLFDKSSFERIAPIIKEEIMQLEEFLGKKIDFWDIKESSWVKQQ